MNDSSAPLPGNGAQKQASDFLRRVVDEIPALSLITDPDTAVGYASDHSLFGQVGTPLAVALPRTGDEVSMLCALASKFAVPIVPRGAGTGLSGGANATDGCLVLSLQRMNRILEIDVDNAVAVVEPGVLNGELSRAVAEHGLFYPPDPGSKDISTIGGNVATNAGGLCCVKYGVTKDYVLGLEVVLPDGRRTRLGRRARKGVAGLDLTDLFVGSEGTLGIVTEVTVRLVRAPSVERSTAVAEFATIEQAAKAVGSIMRTVSPSMLEIMDAVTLEALKNWKGIEFASGAQAVLIAQSDAAEASARSSEILAVETAMRSAGAVEVFITHVAAEADDLVAIRRMAGPALEQLGTVLVDDVAVPVSRLAAFLSGVKEISGRLGTRVAVIGHAGDGNMHPSIVFDAGDEVAAKAAKSTFEEIAALGVRLGGTITGEHGVGTLKAGLLEHELSDVAMSLHRAIKAAIDPQGLMNPGKVLAHQESKTP